jgi:hypothetical protein
VMGKVKPDAGVPAPQKLGEDASLIEP